MGLKVSKTSGKLTDAEIQSFAEETYFNPDQIRHIHKSFKAISARRDDDGVIDLEEFSSALGMEVNELSRQLFRSFDVNSDGVLNFREFLQGLSIMVLGSEKERLRLAFNIYDIDRDGSISRDELYSLCRSCLSGTSVAMTDETVHKLVDAALLSADLDGNGVIDIDEFEQLTRQQPSLLASLSFDARHILGSGGDGK
uniref:EF-hand domain-containing protein n=1 Tax=Chromera velia CCMP2878 TaxID=1169474 RepID=A0A0G4FHK8_9ALVE|eukprot:Cvel_16989.t1-p1 / transcript=Cvel_16989.t1 / gene=Cvel_16989 / organism=Chromera_velia_CCMP2878 / gene_product=Calcineurin subunit B, putative / transcript_product=Calcineurin subunit B, putative / location=Cvel_scaffold1334:38513-42215(+) / protein_length=197 / sequence_SO=supercontig / SO=protein_coding / is_pseudo=false